MLINVFHVAGCGICDSGDHRKSGCDLLRMKTSMSIRDCNPPLRAHSTLPACLDLVANKRKTCGHDDVAAYNGEFVHAKQCIVRGTWFGPLDTSKTRRLVGNPRIKLAVKPLLLDTRVWMCIYILIFFKKIHSKKKIPTLLLLFIFFFPQSMENRGSLPLWYNTSDPTVCNWMMLVPLLKRPTKAEHTECTAGPNLLVVEHEAKVYFIASRDIPQGERLVATYSPSYKAAIGNLTKQTH